MVEDDGIVLGVTTKGMDYDVLEARYVGKYVIWLRFRDGTTGEVDLESTLHGEVFQPLRDLDFFCQFYIHPLFETLAWPNQMDLAPEFLHERVRPAPIPNHSAPRYASLAESSAVPQISSFFGITISMYFNDHGRPQPFGSFSRGLNCTEPN